jgi:hypothetical protein
MLNDKHLAIIDDLIAGQKRKDIEQSRGISHAQLYRITRQPEFIERWEQERARVHRERADRLWRVAELSMDVVLESLDERDPKMAADMLKLLAPGLADIRHVPAVPTEEVESRSALTPGHPTSYTCDGCDKQCKSARGLAIHRRTHAT